MTGKLHPWYFNNVAAYSSLTMAAAIDTLIMEGGISQCPFLGKEPQATNDC